MELISFYKTQESKMGHWLNEFLIMEYYSVIRKYDIYLYWLERCLWISLNSLKYEVVYTI